MITFRVDLLIFNVITFSPFNFTRNYIASGIFFLLVLHVSIFFHSFFSIYSAKSNNAKITIKHQISDEKISYIFCEDIRFLRDSYVYL